MLNTTPYVFKIKPSCIALAMTRLWISPAEALLVLQTEDQRIAGSEIAGLRSIQAISTIQKYFAAGSGEIFPETGIRDYVNRP